MLSYLTRSLNFISRLSAVILISDPLFCSIGLAFFSNTNIFPSHGVCEIPADAILQEVVTFTCPCILKIIDKHIASGGNLGTPISFGALHPIFLESFPYLSWNLALKTFFQIVFAGKKATVFIINCLYTLFNTLMNVTGHHGKHFMVSRQTLFWMAHHPHSLLLTIQGEQDNSLACGGIVLLPRNSAVVQRGK